MVQKQAAYSSRLGSDSFADDDPLAELARIVGFEPPVARDTAPTRPTAPEEPQFNLEDELLREFEVYDAPLRASEEPRAAEPAIASQSRSPVEEIEELEDVFYPEPFVEPAAEAPSARVEPVFEPDLRQEPSFSVDLADELELAVSEPEETSAWSAPEPEPKLRLPLANFAAQPPVRAEPQFVDETPAEPAPQVEPPHYAAAADEASVEDFFADEGFKWSETVSGPASAVPAASIERPADPFGFDDLVAEAGDRSGRPADVAVDAPSAPVSRAEPSFAFSFADDLAASEEFDRSASAAASVEPQAPAVSYERPEATQVDEHAAPAADLRPAIEDEEFDPFAEGEFDLQLDDLELDLSDIEVDLDEPAVAPVVPAARPAPVSLATPVLPAAAPVVTSASAAYAAPAAYTASSAYAAPAPVAVSPRVVPAEVRAAPAKPAPSEFDFTDEPLAFDPAEISEQDDHLESIAHMDVPEVPVPDSKPAPVAYAHDYDLDIDGELATLFDQPSTTPAAAVQAPAAAPVAAAARQTPSLATPVAAQAQAPVQAAAQPGNAQLPPMDDFDAFERALEEDFRHTLDRPSDYAAANAGRINIPMEPKGLSRFGSRGLLMAGTAVVVLLLGGGALYTWLTGTGPSMMSSGEPQVIAADKDPVKILPENPGGKSVPNQDKAVYDSVAGAAVEDPKQESLISSSEEPVDVVQKTLIPETLPLEDESDAQALGTPVGETEDPRLLPDQNGTAQSAPTETAQPATITPRKVRTMIVRPDGTLVAQEAPAEAAPAPTVEAPAATEPTAAPAADKPALAAPSIAAETPLATAPADAAKGPVPTARPSTPADTAAASQAPAPVAQAEAPAAPVAEPAAAPTPAAATPEPAAPEPAAAQPAPAAGGYYIQVASLPSEAEAEKSYKSISSKFGSVVGGRAYEIKRAEIAGKGTYYRVRISAGTKADAAALCERYKAAGGSCLVTK
ncbi:MAG: SPOR domain-containing protein [Hydrogenophaga sp.]|nr:SPOR domain-containing protein [Hydrogenophaga sp.]